MDALELLKTRVVTVSPDTPLHEALDLMDIYQVNLLPVLDEDGRLYGILTDDDLIKPLKKHFEAVESTDEYSLNRLCDVTVKEYASLSQFSVYEQSPMEDIVALILKYNLKHVPVTTKEGKFVGLLGCIDVLQYICDRETRFQS